MTMRMTLVVPYQAEREGYSELTREVERGNEIVYGSQAFKLCSIIEGGCNLCGSQSRAEMDFGSQFVSSRSIQSGI